MTTASPTSRTGTRTVPPGASGPARAFGRSMFTKTLYDNRRIFTVWAAATGLLTMMYASFYPQVTANAATSIPKVMRGFGFGDMTSAAGYLQGAVFGLLVPLLVTFYGAATGARMISGDEDSGYLDLLLAHPIGRTRLLLHRFAALAAGAILIAAVVLGAVLAVRTSAKLGAVSVAGLTAQAVSLALLAVLFGALATTISAATTAGRASVFGLTAGAGVFTYAIHGLAPQIGAGWLRYLVPFHYYIDGEPLKNGLQFTGAGVLAAASAALIAAAIWRFGRRDLG